MSVSILGHAVHRSEDPRFLKGEARYVDDIEVAGGLVASFVRSHHAHARIVSIDADAARRAPGVVAVFTAADLDLPPSPAGGPPWPVPASPPAWCATWASPWRWWSPNRRRRPSTPASWWTSTTSRFRPSSTRSPPPKRGPRSSSPTTAPTWSPTAAPPTRTRSREQTSW